MASILRPNLFKIKNFNGSSDAALGMVFIGANVSFRGNASSFSWKGTDI